MLTIIIQSLLTHHTNRGLIMSETSCLSLAKKIIAGYRIKRGDDLSLFLKAPLAELQ